MSFTILIRTSFRPELFHRAISSIYAQTYSNFKIIVGYDNDKALDYIPENLQKVKVHGDKSLPFFYDNYCNTLKELVTDGWFFFMDDDDFLYDTNALQKLSKHLTGTGGIICQFNRNGRLKPSNQLIRSKSIIRAKIGMPCLILHHSKKNIAHFDGSVGAADYHWIKAVSKKVRLKFVPIALVYADRRSNGSTGED